MTGRILLVDDDLAFRRSTGELLREDGHVVVAVADGSEAVEALKEGSFDLILMDLKMPGLDGIRVVEVLRQWGEGAPILMVTGFGTVESAVEALHTGVDDFLTKPVEPDVLSSRVQELLERRPVGEGAAPEPPAGMVGRSAPMQAVFGDIRKVAPADTTVLITGETGTGKELVARGVHQLSSRDGPFVAVNCASLSPGLLESELFGHREGAFTGAVRDREGVFQAADGGTILLDEVGDVPPEVQLRLLRVLQEKEVTPVGSDRAVSIDVRVIAATNADLGKEVEEGRFRDDLFYRLKVFRIELPPLRDRISDLPLLVKHFFEVRAGANPEERDHFVCSPLAMRMLQAYDWPGNVRELFSALESASIQAEGRRIEAQHLPSEIRSGPNDAGVTKDFDRYRQEGSAREERDAIQIALEEADGARGRAADMLGMSRTTLWRKMKAYGLDEEW